jgi:two-component system phosphate regulon response regulator PhoB
MQPTRVLLAEDDLDVAQILRYRFEQLGFEVTHVTRGLDVLSQCRENRFSVVVLDHMLPGLTGLALCRLLRDWPAYAQVPIIMVSAMTGDLMRRQAAAAGADIFFPKIGFMKDVVAAARRYSMETDRHPPETFR